MSELYTNYIDNQVEVDLPPSTPYVDLSITVNGVPFNFGSDTVVRINQSVTNPGYFKYTLPYRATPFEGELVAIWSFVDSGVESIISNNYELVTAVFPIRKIVDRYGVDKDKAEELESYGRHIINAYTGQTFGTFVGRINVEGNGHSKITLPRKLASVVSVSPSAYTRYTISGSGFFLNSSRSFRNNELYSIVGTWGYNAVPSAVQNAAGLIIDNLASGEPSYRDRYLNAIRSADWRLDYNSRAFDGTGNVVADQLLDPYVLYRMAVI